MYYYHVSTMGTGTDNDPYCPNIPSGTAFVGNNFNDNTCLVATNSSLSGYSNLDNTGLQNICNQYGLLLSDVQTWSVE